MSARNDKSMNMLFGKRRVKQAKPDERWALPSEMIGIEIEVEDFASDTDSASDYLAPQWTLHSDGSLRNGVEWVLSSPLSGTELYDAINKFFDRNYSYNMSERTSVHLHVNASDDLSVDQFRNIFTLMYLIEPAVFRWADENRKWCGYCQPLTDFSPARLAHILSDNDSEASFVTAVRGKGNADRYYGLNVAAFHKHGTLEFRYFPCTKDKATLISWVQFVMEVKRAALTYESPEALLSTITDADSLKSFLENHMPSCAERLLKGLDVNDCLLRVETLSAVLDTDVGSVRGSDRHRQGNSDSKAYQKLVRVKFGHSNAAVKKKATKTEYMKAVYEQGLVEQSMRLQAETATRHVGMAERLRVATAEAERQIAERVNQRSAPTADAYFRAVRNAQAAATPAGQRGATLNTTTASTTGLVRPRAQTYTDYSF